MTKKILFILSLSLFFQVSANECSVFFKNDDNRSFKKNNQKLIIDKEGYAHCVPLYLPPVIEFRYHCDSDVRPTLWEALEVMGEGYDLGPAECRMQANDINERLPIRESSTKKIFKLFRK